MTRIRRTMLFIPGNSPSMIINGDVFGSDSIIYDLEDAVSPGEKDSARILVRNVLSQSDFGNIEKIVRINAINTEYWKKDLDEILLADIDGFLIPKVENKEDIHIVESYLGEVGERLSIDVSKVTIIPLIETALGVENAFEIAKASSRITALFLGAEDLTADLGAKRTKEGLEIFYSRSRLVVAGRAAGVDIIDTPFTDVNDDEGLRNDAEFAKDLGFTGKSVISPRHIDTVNHVFTPSIEEYQYARRVVNAIERAEKEGKGVIALDGKMVDAPIVNRAKQIINMWESIGGGMKI
ncbi:HpcH/HpaI aldolase/citrate lyase family protein [Clostridium sp. Cult3]|uniref:HpcH/HpaI aldolase/citrate lyase family protein n=1 Tax=Clostridium sp. Cult3 TaxID=2079004 RepID=UPI0023518646|nr:aldolase/citrate lyase family protein [Clostridium sp. Cult3]